MHVYRLWTALQYGRGFLGFRKTPEGKKAREAGPNAVRSFMESIAAPQYHSILIPKYDFGAKRPVVDHGYLAATNRENFAFVKCDGFRAVQGNGRVVVDSLGNEHEPDIIIMANGFNTQVLLTPLAIAGEGGQDLRTLWRSRGGAEVVHL